jgi:hypothetical protein
VDFTRGAGRDWTKSPLEGIRNTIPWNKKARAFEAKNTAKTIMRDYMKQLQKYQ